MVVEFSARLGQNTLSKGKAHIDFQNGLGNRNVIFLNNLLIHAPGELVFAIKYPCGIEAEYSLIVSPTQQEMDFQPHESNQGSAC